MPSQLIVQTSNGSLWEAQERQDTLPVHTPRPRSHAEARDRDASRSQRSSRSSPDSSDKTDTTSASEDKLTLNFVDADLQSVVRALAQFTGRNFVTDPRVKGQLTLVSESPVSPDTAYSMLLSALRMHGFAVISVNGVSRVVPEADAKLQGSPVSDGSHDAAGNSGELVTRVFNLRYENATNLVPVLRPMIAPNNVINAYAGNNSIVITDYADNMDRIADVIASIDTPDAISTDLIPIEYGVALDVAALARQLLDGGNDPSQRLNIVADPRSNAVLVRAASPEKLDIARNLIERIDNPDSQAGNLHVVYLRNAQATRLAEVLRGALGGQGGQSGSQSAGTMDGASALDRNTQASQSGQNGSGMNAMASALSTGGGQSQQMDEGLEQSGAPGNQTLSFSAGGATVQADPTTNTLIISAPPPLYRSLREVIDQLDQRRAQVLVESLIVEVNAEDAAEFGVQWMAGGGGLNGGGSSFVGGANFGGSGINPSGATTIDALAQGLSLGIVKGTVNVLGHELVNLSVLARALERRSGANVLSTPNLMTLDNEEASIIVGRTVPFVTGQYTTTGDGASNPFQTIEREDVGLTLRIRPQISEGGTVKLGLYQEVSSIDSSLTTASTGLVTRKRALKTNVLVDDGQIIVLGGLLEDNINDTTSSVPLLGDIPVLGSLFRYESRTRTKTNLMIFLRPHIVRSATDSAGLTLDRYNYMRSAQDHMPRRSTWFSPDAAPASLPDIERNTNNGLLDLRGDPS